MARIVCTCELAGEKFSPALVTQVTGLRFSQPVEVGDRERPGRYRGIPAPGGSATIEVPASIDESQSLLWLARRLLPHMELLRDSGADDIHLNVTVYHDGECAWTLTAEECKAVAVLGIDVQVTACEEM